MKFIKLIKANDIYNDDILKLKKLYKQVLPYMKNIQKLVEKISNEADKNKKLLLQYRDKKDKYDPNANAQYEFADKVSYYFSNIVDKIEDEIENCDELLKLSTKVDTEFDDIVNNKAYNDIEKIPNEVINYMNSNLDPFSANTYSDAINFCKTLMKNPKDYIDDNYENLLNKNIIDEKFDKNKVIKIIDKTLRQYGKDYLSEVQSERESFRK